MSSKLLSIAATLVLVTAVLFLYFTRSLFGIGPVSIGLQAAAVLLMLWARVTFGLRSFHASANPTEGKLVTTGPYRYLRHPIYVAILLFVWTGIAVHPSRASLLAGLVATAATLTRMISEETLLRERYPEYADYARRAKRLVPFVY
jgi:protein-S-isoprenylcysteine O-methyltransferase Ste14